MFCFFAEDTGIFEDGQFSVGLGSHTADDGSDSSDYLRRLFRIMGTPEDQRESLPQHLAAFPFVGESLFGDDLPVPDITRRGRSTILAAGDLDWAAINPDIFGSMIQAVVSEEGRGELGMHYTSVPNIMKVIGPLFLDELHEEFDKAQGSDTRLRKLLHRIHNLHIFDPACGSGNFLIITYKELRRLEMKILKQFNELPISGIRLDHFHGIEIDDFAHETAKLSMWLAEHQMNREFEEVMGRSVPSLPLGLASNVTPGNACLIDWGSFVGGDEDDILYVVGNPPYVGARVQTAGQKHDMKLVFGDERGVGDMDYIAAWFEKCARLIESRPNVKGAFVSTNSICQGIQVSLLWPRVFKRSVITEFAVTSFKWRNHAKGNAGVSVVIVGLSADDRATRKLYDDSTVRVVKSISPYLIEGGENQIIRPRTKSISGFLSLVFGCMPNDGGHLILTESQRDELVRMSPNANRFLRDFIGAAEFIRGSKRFCLWIDDADLEEATTIPEIIERIDRCKNARLSSKRSATRKYALSPHRFAEIRRPQKTQLLIPGVFSEKREYIQCGFPSTDSIVSNLAFTVLDGQLWMLSIISSKMHMVWLRTVGGRLETRYRYSKDLVYNTFPFPTISKQKEEELAMCALRILEVRERYPDRTWRSCTIRTRCRRICWRRTSSTMRRWSVAIGRGRLRAMRIGCRCCLTFMPR